MSKKFLDKVLSSDGTSAKKYEGGLGAKFLKKFGWQEGKGLGKSENGIAECVQVKRREGSIGIGAEEEKKKTGENWDSWWNDVYANAAKGVKRVATEALSDDSSEDDDDVKPVATAGRSKGGVQTGKLRRVMRMEQQAPPPKPGAKAPASPRSAPKKAPDSPKKAIKKAPDSPKKAPKKAPDSSKKAPASPKRKPSSPSLSPKKAPGSPKAAMKKAKKVKKGKSS
jgi:hypothetical protein